jgi:hypothetical protein
LLFSSAGNYRKPAIQYSDMSGFAKTGIWACNAYSTTPDFFSALSETKER